MGNVWRLSNSENGYIENSCTYENYIFNPFLHVAVQGRNMIFNLSYEVHSLFLQHYRICVVKCGLTKCSKRFIYRF